jgi:hypothetical protein
MRRSSLLVALALVVGALAAPLGNRLLVHRAHAAPPEPQHKWEQQCTTFSKRGEAAELLGTLNADLKAHGDQGWELVSSSMSRGSGLPVEILSCYRRPVP